MIKHNEDGNMVLSALVVDEEFCVIDYKIVFLFQQH